MVPATQFPAYVVIEVSDLDTLSPTFPKAGYYLVLNLTVKDAAFLFKAQ